MFSTYMLVALILVLACEKETEEKLHRRARPGGAGQCGTGPVGFGNKMSSSAPPPHPSHTMRVSCLHSESLKHAICPYESFLHLKFTGLTLSICISLNNAAEPLFF